MQIAVHHPGERLQTCVEAVHPGTSTVKRIIQRIPDANHQIIHSEWTGNGGQASALARGKLEIGCVDLLGLLLRPSHRVMNVLGLAYVGPCSQVMCRRLAALRRRGKEEKRVYHVLCGNLTTFPTLPRSVLHHAYFPSSTS